MLPYRLRMYLAAVPFLMLSGTSALRASGVGVGGVTVSDSLPPSLSPAVRSLMRYAGNIHQFCHAFPQEKVYLQFDNTSYYTGETIWFKAYVVECSTHRRSPSRVLYVDLLSPSGDILKQQKLPVTAGQADGSFVLNDASSQYGTGLRGAVLPYPSGFYEIRAYTANMLNFTEAGVFSRVLPVFEKPEKEGDYFGASPVIRNRFSTVADPSVLRPTAKKLPELSADFLPEGGSLVLGVECRVAFRLGGPDGLPADALGMLNDSIPLVVEHDGMGSVTFTPTRRSNTAVFSYGGRSYRFSLPPADASGYVLRSDVQDSLLSVTVNGVGMPSDTLGLTVTCRGELFRFATLPAGSSPAGLTLSLDGVPEGVCQLTLFDRIGTVYGRRTFYRRSPHGLPSLDVTAVSGSPGPFSPVRLEFTLSDGAGSPFRDRFCVSVRDSRSIGTPSSAADLRTSLLLSSDLKGLIYRPGYYFESDDLPHLRALDLLMLVHGWERYDWRQMAGLDEYTERHRLEDSLMLNGWILSGTGRKPLSGVKVMAAVMPEDKTQTSRYEMVTDSTGYFGFNVTDFYDYARLTIKTDLPRRLVGTPCRIELERGQFPSLRPYRPDETVFWRMDKPLGSTSVKVRRGAVTLDETEPDPGAGAGDDAAWNLPKIIYETGIVLPEVEINEKRKYIDYFTFTTYDVKSDTERERDRGEYTTDLYGYLLKKNIYYSSYSNFLLDSVNVFAYVHDSEQYMPRGLRYASYLTIDMMDVKSLIIYDHPMYMRDAVELCPLYKKQMDMSDVINLSLMDGKRVMLIDIELYDNGQSASRRDLFDISRRVTTFRGYSRPYRFYSPEYPDGPVMGDVDYRRTLYWNPNVITDSDGHAEVEFYNNSYSRHFSVSGAGITASGTPYVLDAAF